MNRPEMPISIEKTKKELTDDLSLMIKVKEMFPIEKDHQTAIEIVQILRFIRAWSNNSFLFPLPQDFSLISESEGFEKGQKYTIVTNNSLVKEGIRHKITIDNQCPIFIESIKIGPYQLIDTSSSAAISGMNNIERLQVAYLSNTVKKFV